MKNKPLALLMSVLVAFGLWLYVITVVNPESEKTYHEIPVVIQGKNILDERGLMLVSEDPKVTLDLKSTRTILNNLNEANINVITNVSNLEKPGTYNLTYSISYPGNIPLNEVSVQKSSTDLITVTVENKVTKNVPVEVKRKGTVKDGYRADLENMKLDFANIEITGPESVVNRIEKAVTDEVDLTGRTTTLAGEYQYALFDKQGQPVNAEKITVNTDKVNVAITIQREKNLTVKPANIIYGNGATAGNCTVTVKPEVITVVGPDASLVNLNELILDAVDLTEILEDKAWTVKVADLLPTSDVKCISDVEEITIQVKYKNFETATFEVPVGGHVQYLNLPEGMQVTLSHQEDSDKPASVSVTVRGSADLVKAIQSTPLTFEIDLANVPMGEPTILPIKTIIPGEYSTLGITVDGKVFATLTELPPEEPTEELPEKTQ